MMCSRCTSPIGPVQHCLPHTAESGIPAPVEPDLQKDARAIDGRQRTVHLVHVQRDRLFNKEMLASLRRGDHDLGVGAGGRADEDRVHTRVGR